MFDNIGGKIKTLAKVICWIGIIGSVIGGIVCCTIDEDLIGIGILIMVGGSLISWIGSFFAYGFGELIEKTVLIERSTRNGSNPSEPLVSAAQVAADNKRLSTLQKLLAEGLISEEEYQNAVSNDHIGG